MQSLYQGDMVNNWQICPLNIGSMVPEFTALMWHLLHDQNKVSHLAKAHLASCHGHYQHQFQEKQILCSCVLLPTAGVVGLHTSDYPQDPVRSRCSQPDGWMNERLPEWTNYKGVKGNLPLPLQSAAEKWDLLLHVLHENSNFLSIESVWKCKQVLGSSCHVSTKSI